MMLGQARADLVAAAGGAVGGPVESEEERVARAVLGVDTEAERAARLEAHLG